MGNNIINKLSNLTANQIAAGEVVQRPSSVIKELMENSIDAGATTIAVGIVDGGRSSIQVIDDGCGMNHEDAITAFERHATSKIESSDDLYKLSTFGFRGEALPSIASVSEVELRTMQSGSELGTLVSLCGGEVTAHTKISTTIGTQFCIKNLFYNVPARRKFMKSPESESRNIVTEFKKIALCYPQVSFVLHNNDRCNYNLPITNLRSRISDVIGSKINKDLIELYVDTPLVEIKGYIGRPQGAKKTPEQYLFINGRYFKSSVFNKAIISSYDNLLASNSFMPHYFIFIKCDPSEIDVNIHPSKIEVKFENESEIAHIMKAAVRASLGKNGIMPMIDFDSSSGLDIPIIGESGILMHSNNVNRIYDTNNESFSFTTALFGNVSHTTEKGSDIDEKSFDSDIINSIENATLEDNKLYGTDDETSVITSNFEKENTQIHISTFSNNTLPEEEYSVDIVSSFENEITNFIDEDIPIIRSLDEFINSEKFSDEEDTSVNIVSDNDIDIFGSIYNSLPIGEVTLIHEKYILTSIGDSVYIIDIKRAMSRIMYDRYSENISNDKLIENDKSLSQKLIFPITIPLQISDKILIDSCKKDLLGMGLIIEDSEQSGSVDILGIPVDMDKSDPNQLLEDVLDALRSDDNFGYNIDKRGRLITKLSSIATNKKYNTTTKEDMRFIAESLRKCENFSYAPTGKPIIMKIDFSQIKKILN